VIVKKHVWWLSVLLVIALLPVTVGMVNPYLNTVLILVGIYVILAVSLDLLVGFAGQISAGHAAFFALGAYASGILTAKYNVAPAIALLGGLFASGFVAWGIGRTVLRLQGYYLAVATLGLNAIVVKLITVFASITGGASGLLHIPPFQIFGVTLQDPAYYYYFVWGVAILVIICCLALTKSPFGNSLIAIHSDEEAAGTLGIDCPKYKLQAFVISCLFAGLAGSLFAHFMGFIAPDDFDIFTSILILVMLFLGGVGTIYGAALGAVFLKILPEVTYRFQNYELFLYGLILVLVLIFLPRGLLGILTKVRQQLKESRCVSSPSQTST
jgi:branched-chain amino acid transport system permease protein